MTWEEIEALEPKEAIIMPDGRVLFAVGKVSHKHPRIAWFVYYDHKGNNWPSKSLLAHDLRGAKRNGSLDAIMESIKITQGMIGA
jgi:hypothetical protein